MSNVFYQGSDGCVKVLGDDNYLNHGHKYILKVGNGPNARYFYTQEEVNAYRKIEKGVKDVKSAYKGAKDFVSKGLSKVNKLLDADGSSSVKNAKNKKKNKKKSNPKSKEPQSTSKPSVETRHKDSTILRNEAANRRERINNIEKRAESKTRNLNRHNESQASDNRRMNSRDLDSISKAQRNRLASAEGRGKSNNRISKGTDGSRDSDNRHMMRSNSNSSRNQRNQLSSMENRNATSKNGRITEAERKRKRSRSSKGMV